MNLDTLSLEEIKRGSFRQEDSHICAVCGKSFDEGEIYCFNDRYFEASKAVNQHLAHEHKGYLEMLINDDTKYAPFTDYQKQLLSLINSGLNDKEIAQELKITHSTVRNQKFAFREKAKQAKLYLAIYEMVFGDKVDELVPVHPYARQIDERFIITDKEKEQVLKSYVASAYPLKIKSFPSKEKKKVVILAKISEEFEQGKVYTEKEINEILSKIYTDFAAVRRYLISYGFMKREKDGSAYQLT